MLAESGGREEAVAHTNRLAGSISPYLEQHAHNPVHWYPWGEEAFEKAQRENKPIFLSVGYSTCHWCHVMNRESFENEDIAAVLNEHFVSIKVDREERPDVDRLYMTFVTATTGGGGWPLSVWLTPDLEPFAGGTYYPPEDQGGRPGFRSILKEIAEAWENDQEGIVSAGQRVIEQLERASVTKHQAALDVDDDLLHGVYENLRASYDKEHGGFSSSPKFPRPSAPSFMLRYYARTGKQDAMDMTLHTLRQMAKGGIRDQVGGGFHRYAVNDRWHVPHFEKMLYDQALLVPVYLDAYLLSGDPFFREVAEDILAYVSRDMTGSEGQFYSAEDADSVLPDDPNRTAEGAFYVWTASALEEALSEDADWVMKHWGVREDGNVERDLHGDFAGQNVLHAVKPLEKMEGDADGLAVRLPDIRTTLRELREERPRPHLDNKALTGWNALMISAYARAYQVTGDEAYRDAAIRGLQFIRRELYDAEAQALHRVYRDGVVHGSGFLEDYAFLVQALLDVYESVFDTHYLEWALELQQTQETLFHDAAGGGYFDTLGDDPHMLLRLKDDHDGATPAGNSVAALNLLRLAEITTDEDYRERAIGTVQAFGQSLSRVPHAMPTMIGAVDFLLGRPRQVLIAGAADDADAQDLLRVVYRHYDPNRILMLTDCSGDGDPRNVQPFLESLQKIDGKATAYVCVDHVCDLPVNTVEGLKSVLEE